MGAATSCRLDALGTTAVLSVTEPAALEPARLALERELAAVDRTLSRFRPDSELVWLNARSGTTVRVSARLAEALGVALRAAAATAGIVDPTIGRSLRLAGYDRTFALVAARPADEPTLRLAPVPGYRRVELDERRGIVRTAPGIELDLGATAKALAADRAARAASAAAGCGVLVGLGGDIAVAGEPPAAGWPVLLADDHRAALHAPGAVVAVRDGGLATSSTTVRRWRAGGVEQHHILDPRSGRPAESPWRTVTVAARSCLDANTASTAAIVLGRLAPAWLTERSLPARLVHHGGERVFVGAWPEDER
jgi:thiamine biosynthesis lipoprotein